jgi:hypothetical protein
VTDAEIDRLLEWMPRRHPGEDLAAWLQRTCRFPAASKPPDTRTTAQIIPFKRPPARPVRFIGQVLAYAAAEVGQDLPSLPDQVEIGPGEFRVRFGVEEGQVHVRLEALGFTLARMIGREVAATGPGGLAELIAVVRLDVRGEGAFVLPDGPAARRLLLQLRLGEIEPE